MKFRYTYLWFVFFALNIYATSKEKNDSLQNALLTASTDSEKVSLYLSIANNYLGYDSAKAFENLNAAAALSSKANCRICPCRVNFSFGKFFERFNNYDTALVFFKKSEECMVKAENQSELPVSLNAIGNIFKVQGNYDKASEIFIKSLEIEEKNGDVRGIAVCYNNLGTVYQRQNIYDKAMHYYQKALKSFEQLDDSENCAKIINNIGIISWYKKDLKHALDCYQRTASIWLKLNREDMLSAVYTNIGIVYYDLNEKEKTLEYFLKSLDLRNSSNDKRELSGGYGNIAELYMETGHLDKAIEYAQRSLDLAKEIGIKEELKYAYHTLAMCNAKKGDYQRAFANLQAYADVKDSLVNEQTTGKISELEARYESEKKKRQIEVQDLKLGQQELELNKKQMAIYAISFGLLLVASMAFMIYKGYNQKKKMNEQLTEKNIIIGQKNKDITDSIEYAKTLQDTILPEMKTWKNSLPESFVFFRPRDIVSGDFYFFHHPIGDPSRESDQEKRVYIAAADCTGHGVPGAFVSMVCKNVLNETILQKKISDPGQILTEVNKGVTGAFMKDSSSSGPKDGMDIALVKFGFAEGGSSPSYLEYAGAMNPALVMREGNVIELRAAKMSIGGFTPEGFGFTTQRLALMKNDWVYIFSDGYHSQFGGPKGKKFMYRKLKETLVNISSGTSRQQERQLEEILLKWQGGHERVDDILVIGVKI